MSRPITQTGERVPPSDFDGYRVNYDFRAPCCLCANDAVGGRYTESAVFLALDGKYTGEYVAGCASDTCGYIGGCSSAFLAYLPYIEAYFTLSRDRMYVY